MNDKEMQRKARRRAGAKLGFYIHFVVYVLVNLLLLAINLQTSPGQWWFLWSLVGWGVGLICHGMSVFMSGKILDRMTEHELKSQQAEE